MPVKIRFYGPLKELYGEEVSSEIDDLFSLLKDISDEIYKDFKEGRLMVAVNHEVVHERVKLKDGDLVALLPRFSGG